MIQEELNRKLELDKLQSLILTILEKLHMPVRKTMLFRFTNDIFEYDNTPKEVDFSLVSLIEGGLIKEEKYYIASLTYAETHRHIVPSATEEGIVKYITSLSLKETIKHDLYFDVYAKEHISPSLYFKFLDMEYPCLVGKDRTLHGLEYITDLMEYGLKNQIYEEINDFPTDYYLTTLFSDEDSRLIIKNINVHHQYVNVDVILLPGKRRSYKKAHDNYMKLCTYLPEYFENRKICIKCKLLTMIIGNMPRKRGK